MAMKHGDSRTLLAPNETSSCQAYCDPSCPFSCSDYFPPPPPLSPFSPPPPSSDRDTARNDHRFPPSVIIIIAFLGGAFLIVSYYVIISKSCLWYRTRRNRNHRPNNNGSPSDQSDGGDDDAFDGTRVDHPIWYIRTIGLSQSVINSITLVNYDKSDGLIEGTDCTVCLSEFQEGETLRLLPKCNHAFHVSCIDMWLRSHVNCPLCRAQVVVSGHIVFDDNISSMSRQSMEESPRNIDFSGNLSSREENQMEGTFVNNNNLGGSNSQVRNNSGVLGVIPERANDGGETLLLEGNSGRNDLKEGFVESNGLMVRTTEGSDPIRSSVSGQVLTDVDGHILVDVGDMRLARRAISMDSRSILPDSQMEEIRIDVDSGNGTILGAMRDCDHQQPFGHASVSTSVVGNDSNSDNSSRSGASTTRSFSWSGRFFVHGGSRGAN